MTAAPAGEPGPGMQPVPAPLARTRTSVARQVLSLFDDAPRAVRAHVRGRWATCPFRAVEAQVGPGGRVLEVGCGHGLFSLLAALSDPARSVVGTDVDERKIAHARSAAARARVGGAAVDVVVSPPGELAPGPWDTVAVLDVLYLLDAAASRRLLADAAARLAPDGILLVKEMALTPRWKFRWNRAQELAAVRALGITAAPAGAGTGPPGSRGTVMTFVDPAELGRWMAHDGLAVRHLSLSKGYLHPHHLVIGRRPR